VNDVDLGEKRQQLARFAETSGPREVAPVGPRQGDVSAFSEGNRNLGSVPVGRDRDPAKIFLSLGALAKAAGPDWFYRYPVKDKGRTVYIEGPSVKLANAVLLAYGNADVDTRVIDLGDSWMIHARFWDLETGASLTRPLLQNKNASRLGGEDENRRINIALSIGVSKATRNVIVNLLGTYCDYAFEEAQASMVEKIGKNLAGYREKAAAGLAERGIAAARAERLFGRTVKEMLAPDLAKLSAMLKAIDDGMSSAADTFPEIAGDTPAKGDAEDVDGKTGEVMGKFAAGEGIPDAKAKEAATAKGAAEAGKEKTEIAGNAGAANPEPSTASDGGKPVDQGLASPSAGEAKGGAGETSGAGASQSAVDTVNLGPQLADEIRKKGAAAAKRGVARTIIPLEYKDSPQAVEAYLSGYDAEKDSAKPKGDGK
jgi:hypothetical protein